MAAKGVLIVGCQLPRLHAAEDRTTTGDGARFNFRVRNGNGWFPRPLTGNPTIKLRLLLINFSLWALNFYMWSLGSFFLVGL